MINITEPERVSTETKRIQDVQCNVNFGIINLFAEDSTSNQLIQETILPTASVLVLSNNGSSIRSRVLLDSGSQSNFVTKSFTQRVGIVTTRFHCKVAGFGQFSQSIHERAVVSFKSCVGNYRKTVPVLVTDNITGPLPPCDVDVEGWDLFDVNLADPEFQLSKPVDMLLGASVVFDILRSGNEQIGEELPFLQNTELGWVVGGAVKRLKQNHSVTRFISENTSNLLCREWSEEETLCEQLFMETTTRTPEGRFVVKLPLKPTFSQLGDSKSMALDKLLRMEKRFEKDPQLHKEYVAFMTDYLKLGHMEKLDNRHSLGNTTAFYFPHHAVLRPGNNTTKLRTVFNGSASTSSGVSLNDVLMTGPSLQQDIFNILLRFRFHRYVITADIKKMFRQIGVYDDRLMQLILWRFSAEESVSTYRLNTVTYGTNCAPFLAVRCLNQLAFDFEEEYPEASRVILKDFYMDDALTGHDQLEKLVELKEQLTSILSSAGFELHKWNSNEPRLAVENEGADNVKILGLCWSTLTDRFSFSSDVNVNAGITKRNILSEVQKIYDPLGILSPVVVHGKLVMQNIWKKKLEWDEPLPDQVAEEWKWFCEQIAELHTISFPRHVTMTGGSIELHGFSDAAKHAYGAVIYVRTVLEDQVQVKLLCAKSRIAPSAEHRKQEDSTIPRMELRAATLLAELMAKVKEAITVDILGVHYWTDSMVTIDWISNPAKRWPTFVSNRVTKINELSSFQDWHHVRSKENPADLISRGVSAKRLAESAIWWTGPKFLLDPTRPWVQKSADTLCAKIELQPLVTRDERDYSLIDKYSSFQKLQRIMAYCLRFKRNSLGKKADRTVGHLTLNELKHAHNQIIRMIQQQHFSRELNQLKSEGTVGATSSLITMNPFLDRDGLIRLGGRIQASGVDFNQLHPIILPNKCNVTRLIAVEYHRTNLHTGPQGLLYTLRLKYWPIHGRSLVRKVVHQCLICFRNNPKPLQQIMGQIPDVRLTPGKPFQICGVDFGGPFTIKENFVRTQKTLKVYVALFICLRTRAVHLELVSSLSSKAFIAALRRFAGQRGRSSVIYCDNATNFVGAKNEIKAIATTFARQVEPALRDFCISEEIEWRFIPPRSPNFGGIWEAGIKSVKQHMKRVLGSCVPTYEEMLTLLKQIEGCLNSRPISPLSADPRDPLPLTPGHFITGGPITALPDVDVAEFSASKLSRYEETQKNVQLFWKRWKLEYLNHLQQRNKKFSSIQPNLLVGQLCLIKEDNLPPCTWITGRVIKVHPGPDGLVRVATLYTPKGEIKRSISKLCILPLEEQVGGGVC